MTNSEAIKCRHCRDELCKDRYNRWVHVVSDIPRCRPTNAEPAVHAEQEQQATESKTELRRKALQLEDRQATDREAKAKAAAVDEILQVALDGGVHWGEHDVEEWNVTFDYDDLIAYIGNHRNRLAVEARQRLNVNPNLVTIERDSVPEWMKDEGIRTGTYENGSGWSKHFWSTDHVVES